MRLSWATMAAAVGLGAAAAAPAWGQGFERERDVTITGPGGRTIQRQLRSEVRPGGIERSVNVVRPGGVLHQEMHAARSLPVPRPGPALRAAAIPSWGMGPAFGHHGFGPRGIVERDVIINNRGGPGWGGAIGLGAVGAGLGFLAARALAPAPAPVYVQPAPVVVPQPVVIEPAPPPVVTYVPPQRYQPPPTQVVYDPVADAVGRLRSNHDNSRRDGALTLGRLGDPRAVPALMDRLQNDDEKEVRMAAAWALSEIGDPRAAVPLQRAAMFDKKREVRDAAAVAYARIPREVAAPAPPPAAAPYAAPAPSSMVRSIPATTAPALEPPIELESLPLPPTTAATPPRPRDPSGSREAP